jgi:putative SOS response-associated peptidase YedK
MCGRFTLRARLQKIAEAFAVENVPAIGPRYNIAPTQQVLAIRANHGIRTAALLRWGLVPSWAKDLKIGNATINARAESVATKPAFRAAFKARRCLIVADGFYEWRKGGKTKQPFFIHRRDDEPFAFAGLWERWGPDKLETCSIVTLPANEFMQPLHERMPAILQPSEYDTWLDAEIRDPQLLTGRALIPDTLEDFIAQPVSTTVNSPKNENAACILPLAE